MVREANEIASAMKIDVKYRVTLLIRKYQSKSEDDDNIFQHHLKIKINGNS